jgi:hypothetical protein
MDLNRIALLCLCHVDLLINKNEPHHKGPQARFPLPGNDGCSADNVPCSYQSLQQNYRLFPTRLDNRVPLLYGILRTAVMMFIASGNCSREQSELDAFLATVQRRSGPG